MSQVKELVLQFLGGLGSRLADGRLHLQFPCSLSSEPHNESRGELWLWAPICSVFLTPTTSRIAPGPNWAGSRACYPGRPRRWQEPTHWGYYHDVPLGTCTGEKMKLRTEPQHSSVGCRHPNSWADHPLGMFLLNPVGSEPYRMTLCNLNYFHLNTAEWGDTVLA